MKKLFIILLMVMILMGASLVNAGEPTLAWDASTGDTLKGYIVYYGTVAGEYPLSENVGNVTRIPNMITVLGLNGNVKYYFGVKAYSDGGQSGFSNIIEYTTPPVYADPWEPPPNTHPIPVPPVTIEIPSTVRQIILNFPAE